MSDLKNSTHLFGQNSIFIEEMHEKYLENKNSVSKEWQDYFYNLDPSAAKDQVKSLVEGPSWKPRGVTITKAKEEIEVSKNPKDKASSGSSIDSLKYKMLRMIDKFRCHGHKTSVLDPLGIEVPKTFQEIGVEIKDFDISDKELDAQTDISGYAYGAQKISPKELHNRLMSTYSSNYGVEFENVRCKAERAWLYQKIESAEFNNQITNPIRQQMFKTLSDVKAFEEFLHVSFPGAKRFSVEGGESSVMATEQTIEKAAEMGVAKVIVGMAHRGRLNTLTKIMGKPYVSMLSEFQGNLAYPDNINIAGDVKYHLGYSSIKDTLSGNKISLSMVPNPSHLETVNTVVMGKVRAEQDDISDDKERYKIMGVLIHGDAAFIGQGVVAEGLMIGEVAGYNVNGIIHIIVNNQVGFTANPSDARASRYPTEFAKSIGAPIFHVNGNDAEAVAKVTRLAVEYRNNFKKDAIINIVCYRLHGHNETDEPFFTQPVMYGAVKKQQSVVSVYEKYLSNAGILSAQDIDAHKASFKAFLTKELEASKDYKPKEADWLKGKWAKCKSANYDNYVEPNTGISKDLFAKLGTALTSYPADLAVNSKIVRQLEAKKKMIESMQNIDWSTAEALAFGSLLEEGYKVRLSGQDSGRGTFSHRHSVLHDQNSYKEYLPLNNISDKQAKFYVYDSALSEYGVMGFEYGYGMNDPNALVIWEGQFGDFANGAQIIIDQYIASAETKWLRMNGLVLLLPHGFEGQGPEHSSARLERFLQLCAEYNMQVVNCTTPASYFHALRRQMHRDFRKPLIVMSPKSLLRHKMVISAGADLLEGSKFKPVIGEIDKISDDKKVKRVIICSGKIYYDLYEHRAQNDKLKDQVVIIRMEQLYPFDDKSVKAELSKYANAEVIWCQEEPKNMGSYFFIAPLFDELLGIRIKYIGRKAAASPATGYYKIHNKEQAELINEAFNIK